MPPKASNRTSGGTKAGGRRSHLGQLIVIFVRRGATWNDFGDFLKAYCSEPFTGGGYIVSPPKRGDIACRHNVDSAKNQRLRSDIDEGLSRGGPPMREAYTRSCWTLGLWEKEKNPGVVVHSVLTKAKEFLSSRGLEKIHPYGEDQAFEPDSYGSTPDVGSSQVPESQDLSEVSTPRPRRKRQSDGKIVAEPAIVTEKIMFEGADLEEFFGDSDEEVEEEAQAESEADEPVIREPDPELVDRAATTGERSMFTLEYVTAPSSVIASDDSVAGQRESSTKMRAQTFGYLLQFADRPQRLRVETLRLRQAGTNILHLCGDGMCYVATDGSKVGGCCEGTHMTLGSQELNVKHRAAHTVLSQSLRPSFYSNVVRMFQVDVPDYDGLW